jgi:hypothetical protein
MKLWWQSASLHRGGAGSTPAVSIELLRASVVSTASTRPLYGRGAGSTPAGGFSYARSSVDRALLCDGRGRWFDSSRACYFADVAQREERRSATPERPVRSGSSALTSTNRGLWCNGSMASSNLAGPGSTPGRPAAVTCRGPACSGYRASSGSTPHTGYIPRPRRNLCCGPERIRLSTRNRLRAVPTRPQHPRPHGRGPE